MKVTYEWTDSHYDGLEKIDPQYKRFANIVQELNETSEKAVVRRLQTEMKLDWHDEYNVGVEEIDAQHRKFFSLIKGISDRYVKGVGHADEVIQLDELLDELQDYARLHFQTEERLMAQYHCPLLDNQRREHEIIISELDRQVKSIQCSSGSIAKLVYFLVQWFIKHTVYSDRDVGLFIAKKRSEQDVQVNIKEVIQKITDILQQPLIFPWTDKKGSASLVC